MFHGDELMAPLLGMGKGNVDCLFQVLAQHGATAVLICLISMILTWPRIRALHHLSRESSLQARPFFPYQAPYHS
jgi:hypothetical protein